jgi:hypothetical protein
MAEQAPPPTPPAVGAPGPVAPTQGASHFAIAISPQEILLSLGHTRVMMVAAAPGAPVFPSPIQEWFLTLAMSPTSTVMLMAQLKSSIEVYEKQFGKIPIDPKFTVNTGTVGPKA